jgi:hypothetical protein
MSLICYVKTAMNKRLVISESRGDSNQCTPCRGKPDQHVTRFSRLIHIWSRTIHLLWSAKATFRQSPHGRNRLIHPKEILATKDRLTRSWPWVTSFFLPHDGFGVGERGFSQVVTHLYQLTGPVTPACDRYIQYLLAAVNPSVLNRHR